MKNKDFLKLVLTSAIYGIATVGAIIAVNISVDASSVIRPQHTELANNIDHSLDFIKNNKATIGGAIGAGALLGAGLLGSKNMLLKPPIRRN